jgi:hypothetical protein
MEKLKYSKRDKAKTEGVFARVTPDAKQGLEILAKEEGVSVQELIERLGRGELPGQGE